MNRFYNDQLVVEKSTGKVWVVQDNREGSNGLVLLHSELNDQFREDVASEYEAVATLSFSQAVAHVSGLTTYKIEVFKRPAADGWNWEVMIDKNGVSSRETFTRYATALNIYTSTIKNILQAL